MTRPMSEPSPTARTTEAAYAIRQLQRRPAPQVTGGGGVISAVTLNDYDFVNTGDNLIPDDTWVPVAVGGERYWVEGQSTDDQWTVDLDSGIVTRDTFGLYALWGSVAFVDNSPGNIYGAAIRTTSNNFVYTNAFEIPAAHIAFRRVVVSMTWWGDLNPGFWLTCYQKSGGPLELGLVTFSVALLATMGLGDEFYFSYS